MCNRVPIALRRNVEYVTITLRSQSINPHLRKLDWRLVTGAFIVLASRLLTFPRTPWELDEFHFLEAVRDFDPLRHHPHPPGYPLFVFLGKAFDFVIRDPFAALVTLSIVSCVIGWIALYRVFRKYTEDADVAAAGALIFYLSAAMLIHSPLALADSAAILFLALTFYALAKESAAGAAIFASAAIGCRPQLAIPLLPALAIALFVCLRTWKQRGIAVAVFTVASLAWLLPLVHATDGWKGFADYELHQARYFVSHDADASRGAKSLLRIAARFALRPWGSSITIAVVGILCAIGVVMFLLHWHRRIIPFVVFTFAHLGFAIAAMDPADAVRYALPALPFFALLAALGLRLLRIPWPGAIAIAALSFWYVRPILIDRVTTPSPMVAAARYIRANMPRNTVVLYQAGTRPHVEWLLPDYPKRFLERAMRELSDDTATPAVALVDGSLRDPDAHTFRWRDSEAYTKMTRNFGRVVTVDPLRPEERFLRLRGIHHLEGNAQDGQWRWLEPVAILELPRIGKGEVALTFVLSHDAPYDANDVQILVDQSEAGRASVTKTPVTIAVRSGRTIEIRSARSFRPDDTLRNRDRRWLAVQLLSVEQR